MQPDSRIYVAGHRGLVGSAIVRALEAAGYVNIVTATRAEVDLTERDAVMAFYETQRPEYVFVAAARVGGIVANDSAPVDFLLDNLRMQNNLIEGAHHHDVRKLLFLGSTCIYPRLAPQPLKEEYLLTGPLEPTNEWYAVAKIAGIKLCQAYRRQHGANFIAAMPTNLYGPNDNFDLESSHVLPALLRKCHEAKCSGGGAIEIWGSGSPQREFLHVDDCAEACLFLMQHYDEAQHVNIGVGEDISIRDLAALIARVVGFEGGFEYNTSRPDGTPRKLVDTTLINGLGWQARIGLEEGIASTYEWFLAQQG